jgi:hypothetical protein
MGFPSAGPRDYLHMLEKEALPMKPDLVVIQLFLGNDLTDSPAFDGPPQWHDPGRYLVALLLQRLRTLRNSGQVRDTVTTAEIATAREELLDRYAWLSDPLAEEAMFNWDAFLQVESQRAQEIAGPDEAVYERFFTALEHLERAAGDVPLAFVLTPDEFQIEDHIWKEIAARSPRPLDRDKPQRKLLEWLKARGRPFLDLLPILRAVEPLEDGRKHLYHLQDTHFNARGNKVSGHALAGFIQYLVPESDVHFPDFSPVTADLNDSLVRLPISGAFTVSIDIQGAKAIVEAVRRSAPLFSIGEIEISGEGERAVRVSGEKAHVSVRFRKAHVRGIYKGDSFEFDFQQDRRPAKLGSDPIELISWAYSMGGRRYTRGPSGEYVPGTQITDAQDEAMGIIIDAPVHLPSRPLQAGDKWTAEWKGARMQNDTKGVFNYRETANVQAIESGESPRAHIVFTTTGEMEIPADRNAGRGEATKVEVQGSVVVDLASRVVVASQTTGSINSDFRDAGFSITRNFQAKFAN